MSITLPDLPDGYRWKYHMDRTVKNPRLSLQRKVAGLWWWTVSYRWVHPHIWGSEQQALDNVSEDLVRKIPQNIEGKYSFGTYYPVKENEH